MSAGASLSELKQPNHPGDRLTIALKLHVSETNFLLLAFILHMMKIHLMIKYCLQDPNHQINND